VFRGSFEHLIDQKGRVSIPSRFREIVVASGTPQIVLTRYAQNSTRCLDAYPLPAWEKFEQEFLKEKRFAPNVFLFESFYIGNAQPCELDAHGRILLPPSLREWARITKDVVFSGARDKFRIWDGGAWHQIQSDAEAALHDPEFLAKLNL
jgi:MraZ protein